MTKKILILTMLLCLIGFTVACNDDGISNNGTKKDLILQSEETLVGTSWKLVGFFDAETNELLKKEVSIIEFYPLGAIRDISKKHIVGSVGINTVIGIYDVNYTTSTIQFADWETTLLSPITEDDKFYWAALGIVHKFEMKDIELKLYYNNGKNYLLFERIN